MKAQEDWIEEVGNYRSKLESLQLEYDRQKKETNAVNANIELISLSSQQKEKEISRLQNLVE